MLKTIWKYIKITFCASPFFTLLGMGFLVIYRLLQFCMDLSLKYATDSILTAKSEWDVVVPFLFFFVAMMLGGNTGNLDNMITSLYTKNATKIFTKRFMKRAYDEKQDSYYDSEFYNEYTFVQKNISNTYQAAVTVFGKLFSALASLAVTIAAISYFSPFMLLVVAALSILTVVVNSITVNRRVALDSSNTNDERRAEYYESLLSDRTHAKELRIFKLQDFILKKWDKSYTLFSKKSYDFECKSNFLMNVPSALEQLLSGGMIIFFLYETVNGRLGVGDFVLMYRIMWRLSWGISSIVEILSSDVMQNYKYIQRYDRLITSGKKPKRSDYVSEQKGFDSLEMRGVSYSYPAESGKAVDNVDFSIHKGEVVAILGYNGSGKSTLSKIMCGLLEDYDGQVLLNGKDYSEMDREMLYPEFGVAFQDFTRYSISLYHNVAVGMVERQEDEDAVFEAYKKGKLEDLIADLPEGDKTLLGKEYDKSGQDLSGGQWQRIILSRAYMGNPPLLILDEPTASIDPIREMEMLNDFREMIKGQTAVLISHRIGFARLSDRICMMDQGKLVEQGTHEELLKQGGMYSQLYESQKQLYEEGEV